MTAENTSLCTFLQYFQEQLTSDDLKSDIDNYNNEVDGFRTVWQSVPLKAYNSIYKHLQNQYKKKEEIQTILKRQLLR